MPQLHYYIADVLAKMLQEKARQARLPTSKYIALLIEREVKSDWPEDYSKVFGNWSDPSMERPRWPAFEDRDPLV